MYSDRYKMLKTILLQHPDGCTKSLIFQMIEDYITSKDREHMLQRDLAKLRKMGFRINSLQGNPGGKYSISSETKGADPAEY